MLSVPEICVPWIKIHRTHLDTMEAYQADLERDFSDLVSVIGEPRSVIDIGCGMCGVDVLLHQKFGCSLTLIDSDGDQADWRGGFEPSMLPFSNREAAEALLEANGVLDYRWVDVGESGILTADAAISLLSMGHHYPSDAYTIDADVVVMDIRDRTDGVERMTRMKWNHRVIRTGPKGNRVVFTR